MTDVDGFFYIGSTIQTDIRIRRWNHISMSKTKDTPMLKHFREIGWDNVIIEEVETNIGTKEERLEREAYYVKLNLSDSYCLNKRVPYISPENKDDNKRKTQLAYHYRNKEKRNQYAREYYQRNKID